MLLQKDAIKKSYDAGAIDKTTYETNLIKSKRDYRDKRSAASDSYRLQELLEEKAHAGQAETITAEKTTALSNLETDHNSDLKA